MTIFDTATLKLDTSGASSTCIDIQLCGITQAVPSLLLSNSQLLSMENVSRSMPCIMHVKAGAEKVGVLLLAALGPNFVYKPSPFITCWHFTL